MNCKEFSANISDIARGRLPDAATRRHALEHTENCAACAAHLRREQALTEGLRALAATERATQQAPARLENNLLAAFRAQQTPATPVVARFNFFSLAWARGAAVAAALALVALPFLPFGQSAEDAFPATATRSIAATAGGWALPEVEEPKIVTASSSSSPLEPETQRLIRPAMSSLTTGPTPSFAMPRRIVRRPAPASDFAAPQEIATEFFPLGDPETALPTDELQMVRVRLSRSALAAFGLPYNASQAQERVTADVIIGADGLARAVRFVR
jgi:hypothetical protein